MKKPNIASQNLVFLFIVSIVRNKEAVPVEGGVYFIVFLSQKIMITARNSDDSNSEINTGQKLGFRTYRA